MMALETERCSPQNASSPGPNECTQNPGTNDGSSSDYSSLTDSKSKSAFHQIAVLSQKYANECDKLDTGRMHEMMYPDGPAVQQQKPVSICSPLQGRCPLPKDTLSLDANEKEADPTASASTLTYACHKLSSEFYISHMQNLAGLPFNPFVFPPTRLPALKMHLYNTPNFSFSASDYVLGLQNAKLMCEMLQMQQQQQQNNNNNNLVYPPGSRKNGHHDELEDEGGLPVSGSVYTSPVTASSDHYSRPDSPCSSVNSSRHYGKHCYSPSSKGVPSRSPSPVPLCTPLPFSVDNILRPEFGKLGRCTTASAVPHKRSVSPLLKKAKGHQIYEKAPPPDDSISVTSTKDSMSPRPTTDCDDLSSDKGNDDSSTEKDHNGKAWPAWVYCTRYSDRPSSGKFNHSIVSILSIIPRPHNTRIYAS